MVYFRHLFIYLIYLLSIFLLVPPHLLIDVAANLAKAYVNNNQNANNNQGPPRV